MYTDQYRFFTIAIGGTLGSTQKHDIQFLCTLQYSCTYLTIYFTQKPTEMHLLGHYNYMKILTMQYVDNFNKNFHIYQYFVLDYTGLHYEYGHTTSRYVPICQFDSESAADSLISRSIRFTDIIALSLIRYDLKN